MMFKYFLIEKAWKEIAEKELLLAKVHFGEVLFVQICDDNGVVHFWAYFSYKVSQLSRHFV